MNEVNGRPFSSSPCGCGDETLVVRGLTMVQTVVYRERSRVHPLFYPFRRRYALEETRDTRYQEEVRRNLGG